MLSKLLCLWQFPVQHQKLIQVHFLPVGYTNRMVSPPSSVMAEDTSLNQASCSLLLSTGIGSRWICELICAYENQAKLFCWICLGKRSDLFSPKLKLKAFRSGPVVNRISTVWNLGIKWMLRRTDFSSVEKNTDFLMYFESWIKLNLKKSLPMKVWMT